MCILSSFEFGCKGLSITIFKLGSKNRKGGV
nr:MAG TPA: hypothetical protein [Caudoviricetes sp.]